ncbi:histidine kinase [Cellvibrio zantedeschiae]|uniref:histidine kinase n=1 Tax=Cellvibrio zantedeschiae TaxID=1237077 RepID=A0ABQ3B849_9GAMM|nr:histidine kinase dimerization/phospho-acceptor domain-containing protein [Cellvibrio zantedeschiae]GGY78251.1 histidine kinase [Cellvibrio zantedeschiae]
MKSFTPIPTSYNPFELLRVYTFYRTLLGIVLLIMFEGQLTPNVLGMSNPTLFFYAAVGYTVFNISTLLLLWRVRFSPSQKLLFSLFLIEIAAVVALMHSSGGASSALGYLLLVAAAAGGMLLRGQIAFFLAALASITVISETVYRALTDTLPTNSNAFFSAGILGALIFISAIIFQYLTKKIVTSNQEALSQAHHAAHLQKMAQQIVERMRTGIMVLDRENKITMFNNAASKLLGLGNNNSPQLAGSPELQEKVEHWQRTHKNPSPILRADSDSNDEVKVNFAKLDQDENAHTLIFLEDNRAITQQAQQLKLASLGRLTASIAHEIRNPLAAISHASQLLSEDSSLPPSDKRLVEIIGSHTKRVNQIIENILQLSRRRISNPQTIRLDEWLPKFISDYSATKSPKDKPWIDCIAADPIQAKFDLGQLQQVLTNLCDNGLRYSHPPENCPHLVLEAGIDSNSQQPFIKIIDFGDGISKENLAHLFEPFFTTENTGSGLGLYICKELCESNQALISYEHTHEGLSCFHIHLAHPDKTL